jgi:hypothetical protein
LCIKSLNFYTRVIEIKPKYVIVNNTNLKMLVAQEGFEKDLIKIDPKKRICF